MPDRQRHDHSLPLPPMTPLARRSLYAALTLLLLAMVFNILNFENGLGWISLSAYWQSVIRGLFLLVVVILQARLVKTTP